MVGGGRPYALHRIAPYSTAYAYMFAHEAQRPECCGLIMRREVAMMMMVVVMMMAMMVVMMMMVMVMLMMMEHTEHGDQPRNPNPHVAFLIRKPGSACQVCCCHSPAAQALRGCGGHVHARARASTHTHTTSSPGRQPF